MQIIKNRYSKAFAGASLLLGLVFVSLSEEEAANEQLIQPGKPIQGLVNAEKRQDILASVSKPSEQQAELVEDDREDPFEGREVKYRFQQIAAQFAEDIQFPSFSRPIRNEYELIEHKPNRAVSSSRPINVDDADAEVADDSPRISLRTSQFNYYPGQQVTAEAAVAGLSDSSTVSLDATIRKAGKVLAQASEVVKLGSEGPNQKFSVRFDDLSHLSTGGQGDMDVIAEFKIDGQHYYISSLIRYPDTVARFEGLGDVEVENEYLKIPAHISTSSPGIHAVKGNLYIAESDTPLVHLNAVEKLTSEDGVMVLKAHISALKAMGHEGPYELRDISLTRGASAPNYTVEQGLVEEASYPVAGFSFSKYEDIAYVDERAQARLEFLTKLGSVN